MLLFFKNAFRQGLSRLYLKPGGFDVFFGSLFVAVITWQPFYLVGELNLFELGLYLPNIQALDKGLVLYKDIFYLRGPLEIYSAYWFMAFFGNHIAGLMTFFYIGSVLTLVSTIWVGRYLLNTKLFFYLFVVVLTARTFPRVVFTYWGGLRFVLGILAIGACVKFFLTGRSRWGAVAGFLCACAIWTSIDVGFFSTSAVMLTGVFIWFNNVQQREMLKDGFKKFISYYLAVSLFWSVFLFAQGSFGAYINILWTLIKHMSLVFPQDQAAPNGLIELFAVMVNPLSKNFRHITPLYCYVFIASFYVLRCYRRKEWIILPPQVLVVFLYGIIFYLGILRNVWSTHFEMALQPEKILYFLLLEWVFLYGLNRLVVKWRPRIGMIFRWITVMVIILASLGYSFRRYAKRFPAVKHAFTIFDAKDQNHTSIKTTDERTIEHIQRLAHLKLPIEQAEDLISLHSIINERTLSDEKVMVFPEWAALNYIFDREGVSRFPVVKLAWFKQDWHEQFLEDMQIDPARIVIMPKVLPEYFERTHFLGKGNKKKYDDVYNKIQKHYVFLTETNNFNVYHLKKSN